MEIYSALEMCLAAEKVCRKETILGAHGDTGDLADLPAVMPGTIPAADRRSQSTWPRVVPV